MIGGQMSPRQLFIFRVGCWSALATAAVHMIGEVQGLGSPANDVERQLMNLSTSYHFALPGGASRSLMDLFNGFSLMFALLLATIGAIGLMVHKRARQDTLLMLGVARTLAVSCGVMLVVSMTNFFIIPTMFIALITTCFALASVQPPG
jgi:hypothetical protein